MRAVPDMDAHPRFTSSRAPHDLPTNGHVDNLMMIVIACCWVYHCVAYFKSQTGKGDENACRPARLMRTEWKKRLYYSLLPEQS